MISCATFETQISSDFQSKNDKLAKNDAIEHTFYLLGDAGKLSEETSKRNFSVLKEELQQANENSTILFLGDNIYQHGMPNKNDPDRERAELILDAQINLVKEFQGHPIFIPGNHDYYNNGIEGLERQAKYVTNALDDKKVFLPEDGCPIEKVTISDNAVLLIIDSQWYLENWDNNPNMNDACEIKTRTQFFDEFESHVKKNAGKIIYVAMHHPMFSNGPHGGQYTWKRQLYPSDSGPPLPILGSIANFVLKTSGISPQDIQNKLYLEYQKRIVTIAQRADNLVFLSGHEHSLQYLIKDNKPQIISGAGSKSTGVRNNANGGIFSHSGLGYVKLTQFKSGAVWASFIAEEEGQQNILFKTELFSSPDSYEKIHQETGFEPSTTSSVYRPEETKKSKAQSALLGKHYRDVYSKTVRVPIVQIDTLFGGLTPIRKGGGMQSRSLRLVHKETGKEYVMRAIRKSATQFFQAAVFKDQYIEGQFNETYTEELMFDLYTTAHPYTSFAIGTMADAIDIYHTTPTLYYIPKQKGLLHYNDEFGDELYMIEERPTDGHGDLKNFGYSNEIISTRDMLKKLRKSDNNTVDESTYIRARLFDLLIGDWDRHQDQWRWAAFQDGKKKVYKPIPRDRDQAFSKFDGILLQTLNRVVYDVGKMQSYKDDIRNIRKFNISGYPLDIALINEATFNDWQEEVEFIQKELTNNVIDAAFQQLPVEVQDHHIDEIKQNLKIRLKRLNEIAKRYFEEVSKYVVVKGTDKDNWFVIDRKSNGDTFIQVFNIKDDKKGSLIHEKLYLNDLTKEIWVYGLDDDDIFEVIGSEKKVKPLVLVGGQNHDEYHISSGKKVRMFDFKRKKNTFTTNKGRKKLTNDYELNLYDYKKLRNRKNLLLPMIGFNPDDGVRLGFTNSTSIYGYNRNPFSQKHIVKAFYYFATNGFDVHYTGEFANIFKDWNFMLEGKITSPNYSINFYDYGNESTNFEDEFNDDYHRVRFSAYGAYPSLKWEGRMGSIFKIGGVYESIEVEKTPGRFIETLPNVSDERQYFVGGQASYIFENSDNSAFPTLGFHSQLDLGVKTNIEENYTFGYVIPSLGFAYKLTGNGKVVLATKFKGHIIIGDEYEFYYGANIGGKNGLRGYRNQRFIGDKAYYQNTDVRFDLGGFKTAVLPMRVGLFGGFDYGRVWLDGENSNDWKTSYGGGLWLIGADMININTSIFGSKDGAYFSFGLGFGF
ncbi:metallophosphoesterase [Urechidicola sp. KH5]